MIQITIKSEIAKIDKTLVIRQDEEGFRNKKEMIDANVRLISGGLSLAHLDINYDNGHEVKGTFKGTDKQLTIVVEE